jgi:hypothetical protein
MTYTPDERKKLPPLPKPIRNSKHWDEGIERAIAGERAARLEREDQLLNLQCRVDELEAVLRLIEHKADQRLQGQYTEKQIVGLILAQAREALLAKKSTQPAQEESR